MDANIEKLEIGTRISGKTAAGVPKTFKVTDDGYLMVSITDLIQIRNALHDNLNANANIQLGNTDISDDNPIPVLTKPSANSVTVSVTRPDNNTAYSAGDVVGGLFVFENVLSVVQNFLLLSANFSIFASSRPVGMSSFYAHFFKEQPTAYADNDAFNLVAADRPKYIGCVPLASPLDLGDTLWSQNDGINMAGKMKTHNLYVYVTTSAAYTPTPLIVKELTITLIGA